MRTPRSYQNGRNTKTARKKSAAPCLLRMTRSILHEKTLRGEIEFSTHTHTTHTNKKRALVHTAVRACTKWIVLSSSMHLASMCSFRTILLWSTPHYTRFLRYIVQQQIASVHTTNTKYRVNARDSRWRRAPRDARHILPFFSAVNAKPSCCEFGHQPREPFWPITNAVYSRSFTCPW